MDHDEGRDMAELAHLSQQWVAAADDSLVNLAHVATVRVWHREGDDVWVVVATWDANRPDISLSEHSTEAGAREYVQTLGKQLGAVPRPGSSAPSFARTRDPRA
ncbi:MAG: hypothetical protein ACRDYU_17790 [Actinomycetes bacterium]